MAKGLLQPGRVTNRRRSPAAPCIPAARRVPPRRAGPRRVPRTTFSAGRSARSARCCAAARAARSSRSLRQSSPRHAGGRSRAELGTGEHRLCPHQTHPVLRAGAWAALGNPAGLPERGQGLGPAAPGACGGARRQSSLASRWIAAPLQFRIPFLPDKPRRIFINQSATLFNKNLLTYK